MFGNPEFASMNRRLNQALAQGRPLIATHRGLPGGMIIENTLDAARAALRCHSDMVEIDIVRSTDGEFFCFHDGYEPVRLATPRSLLSLSGDEIRTLSYYRHWEEVDPPRVEPLDRMLTELPDALFNIDRSWRFWDTLLDFLVTMPNPERLLMKCPVSGGDWLGMLAECEVKFPVMAIVRTPEEIEIAANVAGINLVAIELLTTEPSHPFAQPEFVADLHARGLASWVNAINLENRVPLFAGWDDNTSILGNPDDGWGELLRRGYSFIQTDWPAMLHEYLGSAAGRERLGAYVSG